MFQIFDGKITFLVSRRWINFFSKYFFEYAWIVFKLTLPPTVVVMPNFLAYFAIVNIFLKINSESGVTLGLK